MKKIIWVIAVIFIVLSVYIVSFAGADDIIYEEQQSNIVCSSVIAISTENTNIKYSTADNAKVVEAIKIHTPLEILKDYSSKWYYVKNIETGREGWISSKYLFIPPDKETNNVGLGVDVLEQYVQGFTSKTNYLLWTDIDRQRTYIFEKVDNRWTLQKDFPCATGKNVSPTKRGQFQFTDRGSWFYSERLNSGAKYWIRYSGSYLFHSVSMDKDKNIIDGVVGERRSSGCVRFLVDDIKWIFENVPDGTTVFIN